MPMRCSVLRRSLQAAAICVVLMPSVGHGFVATEFTQILNNLELVGIAGKSVEQVNNQLTQINQLAQQIQNQIRIYENMLQNTLQLSDHEWGRVEADFARLRELVEQGEAIAYSMSGLDETLKQRFPSFRELADAASHIDPTSAYEAWSNTNRDTIASSLRAAGLTAEQFASEAATMSHLRLMSENSVGHMQALQVAHQLAAQQVEQSQKLRGLVSQQIALMGTWYQSEQAQRDLAQQRRERFFAPIPITAQTYQQMEPRW